MMLGKLQWDDKGRLEKNQNLICPPPPESSMVYRIRTHPLPTAYSTLSPRPASSPTVPRLDLHLPFHGASNAASCFRAFAGIVRSSKSALPGSSTPLKAQLFTPSSTPALAGLGPHRTMSLPLRVDFISTCTYKNFFQMLILLLTYRIISNLSGLVVP
ncbi:unnamed protein product [Rangifer tarandus platyrhynchus]|uniref:Uncharacterized protein n=1 Tax=Rangifer tarandus platyrhynchus TaxID=3082113 RepID=A0AC59Z5M5_RANTA